MSTSLQQYLALGDSYTIGEGVPPEGCFPWQFVQLLQKEGIHFAPPTIIARTGWTSDELVEAIRAQADLQQRNFDWVTLLIGVNNQYRERDTVGYAQDLTRLIHMAINFAGGDRQKVRMLSIPDWSVTPFAEAEQFDLKKTASEIDRFNASQSTLAAAFEIPFIDLSRHYRQYGHLPQSIVEDRLHPSASIYKHWAEQLADDYLASFGHVGDQ